MKSHNLVFMLGMLSMVYSQQIWSDGGVILLETLNNTQPLLRVIPNDSVTPTPVKKTSKGSATTQKPESNVALPRMAQTQDLLRESAGTYLNWAPLSFHRASVRSSFLIDQNTGLSMQFEAQPSLNVNGVEIENAFGLGVELRHAFDSGSLGALSFTNDNQALRGSMSLTAPGGTFTGLLMGEGVTPSVVPLLTPELPLQLQFGDQTYAYSGAFIGRESDDYDLSLGLLGISRAEGADGEIYDPQMRVLSSNIGIGGFSAALFQAENKYDLGARGAEFSFQSKSRNGIGATYTEFSEHGGDIPYENALGFDFTLAARSKNFTTRFSAEQREDFDGDTENRLMVSMQGDIGSPSSSLHANEPDERKQKGHGARKAITVLGSVAGVAALASAGGNNDDDEPGELRAEQNLKFDIPDVFNSLNRHTVFTEGVRVPTSGRLTVTLGFIQKSNDGGNVYFDTGKKEVSVRQGQFVRLRIDVDETVANTTPGMATLRPNDNTRALKDDYRVVTPAPPRAATAASGTGAVAGCPLAVARPTLSSTVNTTVTIDLASITTPCGSVAFGLVGNTLPFGSPLFFDGRVLEFGANTTGTFAVTFRALSSTGQSAIGVITLVVSN